MQAGLDRHLADLRTNLLKGTYRPKLVKRIYIPKANGRLRPLGIPSLTRRRARLHRNDAPRQLRKEKLGPARVTVEREFSHCRSACCGNCAQMAQKRRFSATRGRLFATRSIWRCYISRSGH